MFTWNCKNDISHAAMAHAKYQNVLTSILESSDDILKLGMHIITMM